MKKATVVIILAFLAFVVVLVWIGSRGTSSMSAQNRDDTRAKMQQVFTDPAQYRATLVEAIRDSEKWTAEQRASPHGQLFAPGGYWATLLAEKDAILAEALGPGFKGHPRLAELEVLVLINLGKLEMIRNQDKIKAIQAGDPQ
jgi:hypothetical protein